MTAQRYTGQQALRWMHAGNCPECGNSPEAHGSDVRFWMPNVCGFGGLTYNGVIERIAQFNEDMVPSE